MREKEKSTHAWEGEVDAQVKEMFDNGIVRPSSSPWNSPILIVIKKDNSTSFVCDFRGLNDIPKKDTYPLPRIGDVLDKMNEAIYWTKLDAAAAYWSMTLSEVDKEKTAFSVYNGNFEFNVTPYGLCNAGVTYKRMMDMCLSGAPPTRIWAYMDDIIIFTKSFADHVSTIEVVLNRFREMGVSLKAGECQFAAKQIEFLGFHLSDNGIRPQKRLTKAIELFDKPNTKKEVKRFLGLADFYR